MTLKNDSKRIILFSVLFFLAAAEVLIYWNQHLYTKSKKIEDASAKIKILERAARLYPPHEAVYYELGKAYLELTRKTLSDVSQARAYLILSVENFLRALRINPASSFAHFNLAQSLLTMSYLSSPFDVGYFDEYKKAALLAGHHSQIFYEVGRVLLSLWPELSGEERDFCIEILKKILKGGEREKLRSLMQIWELNVKDYEVMERILPEDSRVFREYAEFIGQKSLSVDVRQNMLARAELLVFQKARDLFNEALKDYQYYWLEEASRKLKSCASILKKIRFYQNLIRQELIGLQEYKELCKSVSLHLARCLIEEGREFKEVEGHLRSYLALEDRLAAVGELESYLLDQGLIKEGLETRFEDLERVSFKVFLYFRHNSYHDIMRIGRSMRESFVVVPKEAKRPYVELLQIVGDSFQKVDYIFDADEFYRKALEVEPHNLGTLLRMRQNYERMNEYEKIREVDQKIREVLSPEEILTKNSWIDRGRRYSRSMIFDGRKINLRLHLRNEAPGPNPLISVFFNGRVVWENYLEGSSLTLPLDTLAGANTLVIVPVNRGIDLLKITYE